MPPVLLIVAIVRRRQSLLQRRQQFAGDGINLPDFAEVAFVLVAGRLQSEPRVAYLGRSIWGSASHLGTVLGVVVRHNKFKSSMSLGQKQTLRGAAKFRLFDYLVGAAPQRVRNSDAKCLGGLEIDE